MLRLFTTVSALLILSVTGSAHDSKCQGENQLRSVDYNIRTTMKFKNYSKGTKLIYWINYGGARVLYSTLKPNRIYTVNTFVTHPWVVTSASGKCFAIYLPNRFPMSFSLNWRVWLSIWSIALVVMFLDGLNRWYGNLLPHFPQTIDYPLWSAAASNRWRVSFVLCCAMRLNISIQSRLYNLVIWSLLF